MRKADSLRHWLTAALPELATHPDRLAIYIDAGQVKARQSHTLSYTYAYTLSVCLWDFAGDADHIIVPLLAWIEREQPQLLRQSDSEPFAFKADLLDGDSSDIVIEIDLTENRLVHLDASGQGYAVSRPEEPDYGETWDNGGATFRDAFANLEAIIRNGAPTP